MVPSTEQLIRELEALRQENARLKGVEAELAVHWQEFRGLDDFPEVISVIKNSLSTCRRGWEWI